MLLDSTFLHDLVRQDDAAVNTLEELIATDTPVALSTLTVFEVGIGLRGDAARLRDRFDDVVDEMVVIPLGREQAERALSIQHPLYDRGEPIGAVDALLAGTAATLDDSRVLTRNVDEFARVEAIKVVEY